MDANNTTTTTTTTTTNTNTESKASPVANSSVSKREPLGDVVEDSSLDARKASKKVKIVITIEDDEAPSVAVVEDDSLTKIPAPMAAVTSMNFSTLVKMLWGATTGETPQEKATAILASGPFDFKTAKPVVLQHLKEFNIVEGSSFFSIHNLADSHIFDINKLLETKEGEIAAADVVALKNRHEEVYKFCSWLSECLATHFHGKNGEDYTCIIVHNDADVDFDDNTTEEVKPDGDK